MRKFILAGVLLVVACASTSQQVAGPDRTTHQIVKCRNKIERCYTAAADLCQPGMYTIIDSGSEVDSVNGPLGPIVTNNYHLLVRCK